MIVSVVHSFGGRPIPIPVLMVISCSPDFVFTILNEFVCELRKS